MGWVTNFFNRAMAIQENVLFDFPEDKRMAGYGRAAEVIIDGPQGGVFELWFCEQGVRPKPQDVEIKNQVYMTEETLLDMITPDLDLDSLVDLIEREGSIEKAILRLYPRLDFRSALANGLVTVGGEMSDVDSEEWSRILENVLLKIAFPIVIKGLLKKGVKGGAK